MFYTSKLFAKTNLHEYFEKKKEYAQRRALNKRIRPDTDEQTWTKNFINEFLFDPININLDQRKLEYRTRINNPERLYIVIKVPYSASKELLDLTPSQYKKDQLPLGARGNSYITLFFEADIFDSNDVHRVKYENTINTLLNCVELVNKEVGDIMPG